MPNYCPPFTPMHEIIPEGESGNWRIEHFEVDEKEVKDRQLNSIFSFSYGEYYDLVPGQYVRLLNEAAFWNMTQMTDTPMERRTNLEFIRRAHGDVLIGGLGIGMIVVPLFEKEEVTSIRVIENSPDVIKLVLPHLENVNGHKPFEVIEADMMEYWTDDRFNVIYFDIWPAVTCDNLQQMGKLHRRWTHRSRKDDPERWVSSWRHRDCQDRR